MSRIYLTNSKEKEHLVKQKEGGHRARLAVYKTLAELELDIPSSGVKLTSKLGVWDKPKHQLCGRIDQRPLEQMPTQNVTVGVSDGDMQMCAVTRQGAGEREDFELLLEYSSVRGVGKADDGPFETPNTGQDISGFDLSLGAVGE